MKATLRAIPTLALFVLLVGLTQQVLGQCAAPGTQAQECGASGKKKPETCCVVGGGCDGRNCAQTDATAPTPAPPTPPDNGGGDCPTMLVVSCILWATTGGRGQHLHAMAGIMDEQGNPVEYAKVDMKLYFNDNLYREVSGVETYDASGSSLSTYPGLEVECPNQMIGTSLVAGITPAQCGNSAPNGMYKAEVTGVTKDGCDNAIFVSPGFSASCDHERGSPNIVCNAD